jgi:hypothetical protein
LHNRSNGFQSFFATGSSLDCLLTQWLQGGEDWGEDGGEEDPFAAPANNDGGDAPMEEVSEEAMMQNLLFEAEVRDGSAH